MQRAEQVKSLGVLEMTEPLPLPLLLTSNCAEADAVRDGLNVGVVDGLVGVTIGLAVIDELAVGEDATGRPGGPTAIACA